MTKIGAVILAAGMSSRMGSSKQLLPLHGKPLIYYPISQAFRQNFDPIVVIAGKYIKEIEKVMIDYKNVTYLYNQDHQTGMASSLKLGIEAVSNQVDAVFIFLGDQPFVPDEVVQKVIEEYKHHRTNGVRIVRPFYDGKPGHPILFDASLFEQFQHISGDEGGRNIIRRHQEQLKLIDFSNSLWGMDVDTPEDYERVKKDENNRCVESAFARCPDVGN